MHPDLNASEQTRLPTVTVFAAFGIGLYVVLFLWGFFDRDFSALGFNFTIFYALAFWLFSYALPKQKLKRWDVLAWIIPLLLIASSFSLYENPYLKFFSFLLLPVLIAVVSQYVTLAEPARVRWNYHWLNHATQRIFSFLPKLGPSCVVAQGKFLTLDAERQKLLQAIVKGVAIFALLAILVVIPLLASAEPEFGRMMSDALRWVSELISWTIVGKIVAFIVIGILLIALHLSWFHQHRYEQVVSEKKQDAVVAGIVLGGILALYVLFLWTQINSLWVPSLPTVFEETELLVKSGFWQLFMLTVLNACLYFIYYGKTHAATQRILLVFMGASVLLLLSAAHRLGMYVTFYGFSYEKFFSAYTVIFAFLLFARILRSLVRPGKADVFRFGAILFLWMYAIATISPVEQLIWRANHALHELPGSRIDLGELWMLSADVLPQVEAAHSENDPNSNWSGWLEREHWRVDSKMWYELNLQNVIYKLSKH